ncbi:MAG: hypothetical protein ACD_12C00405G0003 [uncultured bacterium]|nr:MAG: hypothetical protein ACD_12C00405G0003 [uncultured bacterium]
MDFDLNKKQLERLSEIVSNVGIVIFATIVTPILTNGVLNYSIIATGLFITVFSFFTSLYLLK